MRHQKKHGLKLGTDASHTRAIKRNLVNALFLNDRIKTTEVRAKAIRGDVDRIITWAKRGDLHSRRLALAKLDNKEVVREVFEKVEQGMWADRNCGFTRIYRLGPRKGDNAQMVIMELVTEPVQAKKKASTTKTTEVKPAEAAPVQEESAEPQTSEVTEGAPVEQTAEAEDAPQEAQEDEEKKAE